MQRFGKNIGGYHGDPIGIDDVLQKIALVAGERNWRRDSSFLAYLREPSTIRNRVYISTGIHGDEPAGPLAALQLLEDDQWPADTAVWLCPCLNPTGFPLNRRENSQGIDLNRDYRHLQTAEIRAHTEWLQKQPGFDLSLCLHEDWESQGFYVYELNPTNRPSLAEKIIEAVAKVCPIDPSPIIETWTASAGIIRPQVNPPDRPQWPEALYLIIHKTSLSYTLEAPSDFPLPTRVEALVTGVKTAMGVL
ncbi:MAG TPA: M14 family metallocarboxypeptidase [Verrucomicrobiae bacterium]|nr:M14 family metallocarboxypeptidase [Verrucomicrobiae bacterium]